MSRTIWKLTLPDPGDLHHAPLPAGARVVHAAIQRGAYVAWVEVDPDAPVIDTTVHVVGTGWPIPEDMYGADVRLEHRATLIASPFVWHVYQGVTV